MAKNSGIYEKLWKFIKESRNYFIAISAVFLAFALIGFLFPVFFAEDIIKFVEQLASQIEGLGFFQIFIFILKNNFETALMGMILGSILGIFPILLAISNGYVLGFIAEKSTSVLGYSVLLRLLPHGIFEIPALILSLGLGLRIGMFIFKKAGKRKKNFICSFGNSMKVFLYIIIPLLIVAALIEALLIVMLK